MKNQFKLSVNESAGLRSRLEDRLTGIFTNNTISKYKVADSTIPVLQMIQHCPDHVLAYPQTKLAFDIWLGMHTADRHAVLGYFNTLYAALTPANAGSGKTLTFCALFVNELAAVFATTMEQPD